MHLQTHAGLRIQWFAIGREQSPLLVIDDFVSDPERLVRRAATRLYRPQGSYYPGIRAEAPLSYQALIVEHLGELLFERFSLQGRELRFPMCHFSLVTTSADRLDPLQRIPHFDSLDGNALATVHYLFHADFGGTAFYRHRATGFESVDAARKAEYFAAVEREAAGADRPDIAYINGDSPLYEQTASQAGLFNRMIVYRRNVLHSGSIAADFKPDSDPRSGRLSINCFIDVLP
jgi:hypothetical protein